MLADASNAISFADASGSAEALAAGTASAFAQAEATACGEGVGSASAIQENLATAIVEPYAAVYGLALAQVAGETADADITVEAISEAINEEATADSTSDSQTEGNCTFFHRWPDEACTVFIVEAESDGVSEAGTDTVEFCGEEFDFCCNRQRNRCSCRAGYIAFNSLDD